MYLGGTYIAIAEVCPVCGSARFCTEVVVTRKKLACTVWSCFGSCLKCLFVYNCKILSSRGAVSPSFLAWLRRSAKPPTTQTTRQLYSQKTYHGRAALVLTTILDELAVARCVCFAFQLVPLTQNTRVMAALCTY